ncbi:MAG: tetratricopeptide repeat protein [Saprospiraceae bacterium]|nr:tetratricopeptide repeat protein [Saprospiraceae bacterium]
MIRSLPPLLLSLWLAVGLFGKEALPATWEQAGDAYQNKQYTVAFDLYQGLLDEGHISPALYYNLGNVCYRQHKLGLAILYYEKALKLAPRDQEIKGNLALAKSQQTDQIDPLPPFFLDRWQHGLQSLFSANTWSLIGLLFLWVGVGGLVLWILGKERGQRKWGFIAGISLLILSLLPFYLSSSRAQFEQYSGTAILLEREYGLRSAPEEGSKILVPLHEGVKLVIIDRIGDWLKVKLEDGEQGWLPEKSLGMI